LITFEDKYVGANGTDIANHTPIVGGNYTAQQGNLIIAGNALWGVDANTNNRATVDVPGIGNVRIASVRGIFQVVDPDNQQSQIRLDGPDNQTLQLNFKVGGLDFECGDANTYSQGIVEGPDIAPGNYPFFIGFSGGKGVARFGPYSAQLQWPAEEVSFNQLDFTLRGATGNACALHSLQISGATIPDA